jgi:hypothetical protein
LAVLPDNFFQPESLGTLFGCVAVTTVVTGGLQRTFGWSPAATGLVVSFLVIVAGLFLADRLYDVKADIVGFFNAFLVFASAAGASAGIAAGGGGGGGNDERGGGPQARPDQRDRGGEPPTRPWIRPFF